VNPAEDFVEVSVQSMFVLVPRWRATAIVRMIADELPLPSIRGNNTLGSTSHTAQKGRTDFAGAASYENCHIVVLLLVVPEYGGQRHTISIE